MLNVIMLSVIMLSVVAPKILYMIGCLLVGSMAYFGSNKQ